MAQIKLIFACLFLILIFSQEIQPIEGRHLKLGTTNEVPKLQTQSNYLVKETRKIAEHISSLHGDDMTNSKAVHASVSAPPAPKQVKNESQPPPHQGHVDKFRPTPPGHSPGVGKGKIINEQMKKLMNKQEYSNSIIDESAKETRIHGSQTAHNAVDDSVAAKRVNIFPPMTPNQSLGFGNSAAKNEDDSRPTTPGNSPGVGHKFEEYSKEDTEPAAGGKSSGGSRRYQERSTSPGHSPGVGHVLQNRN